MAGPADARSGSTLTLLSDVVGGIGRLLSGELRLAREEAAEGLKTAGGGLAKLAIAAVMGLVGLNILAGAAVVGLAALGLGPGWAALIVGVALCLLAFGFAQAGRSALRLREVLPSRALRGLWRDGEALRAGLRADVTEGDRRDGQDE